MKDSTGMAPKTPPVSSTPSRSLLVRSSVTATIAPAKPRPLSLWLSQHPPGWVSHQTAQAVDPIAVAAEIHELSVAFNDWLCMLPNERWDTFRLQSLSAALFSRYQIQNENHQKTESDVAVELLQLSWPPGSERIHAGLAELQRLLGAPLAVFKAVRSAVDAAGFPCADEIRLAEAAIDAARDEIRSEVCKLGEALRSYPIANRPLVGR